MSPAARIYADYNATAPLRPEAREAMARALELTGNPSSVHAEGRKARALVEGARETIAAAIGACRDDIAFVSGGTEAVAAPIWGALNAMKPGKSLLASAIEHDAVASIMELLKSKSVAADAAMDDFLSHPKDPMRKARMEAESKAVGDWPSATDLNTWLVDSDGRVDLDFLSVVMDGAASIEGVRPLFSLMLVNNETGVIQDVAKAAGIVHAAGGLIHCDAIQALGKTDVSVIELDVDYLSLSAHKIGGPQGMGAFYVKPGTPFRSVQTGGGQEFGRRAGTENVAGIAGFAAATDAALTGLGEYQALGADRDRMEARLKAAAPGLMVHGEAAPRVAGVSCFGVEGLPSETQIMGMDLAGFAVSAGSACSSGKVKPSRVLSAMGLGDTAARSAIRASFGWASKAEDFDALAEAWIRMARRARPNLVKDPNSLKDDVHV
jgi:cysteine desulfurase